MGILEGGKVHICVQSSVLNHTFLEIFVFVFSMFTFVLQILESTLQIFKKILIVCLFWQCFFFFFLEHFRCLAENAGDVAFVKDTTVLENTNGKCFLSPLRAESLSLQHVPAFRFAAGKIAYPFPDF